MVIRANLSNKLLKSFINPRCGRYIGQAKTKKCPMQQPPLLVKRFEQFLQALPNDVHQLAYDFKAFTRSRKIRSPQQLLEVVMLYCGMDLSLRNTAASLAQSQGYISDTGVKKD